MCSNYAFQRNLFSLYLVLAFIDCFIISAYDPARLCGGNGYRNVSDGLCVCSYGFHGSSCQYKHCPFGESWLSEPKTDNVREVPLVPCSNMGYCNPLTGTCECRDGYIGRACERIGCPSAAFTREKVAIEVGTSAGALISSDFVPTVAVKPCSGHGVCMSIKDAGESFDGYNFVRPPITYTNWDAEKLQGCFCDSGWEGHDCSYKSCPKGVDPTENSAYHSKATFVLECKATGGYFSMLVMGKYTPPIPHDADQRYLKYAIEQNPDAGEVTVAIQSSFPSICGQSSIVQTHIQFDNFLGDRPPIFLTKQ